jgi:hypothetical protein
MVVSTRVLLVVLSYIDGFFITSNNTDVGDMSTLGESLFIGKNRTTSYFKGSLDDVRIYNRALTAGEISAMYRSGQAKLGSSGDLDSGTTLKNGLVGHWTMDGKDINWSSNTMVDKSGNGNTGTLTNMSTTTSPVMGKVGQGLQFDGVDDYINIGTLGSLGSQLNNGFTYSAWIYRKSDVGQGLFSSRISSNYVLRIRANTDHNFGSTAGRLAIMIRDDNVLVLRGGSSSSVVPINTWTHIIFTLLPSTNTIGIYVNGVSVPITYGTQQNPSAFINFTQALLGADQNLAPGQFYSGLIDDVRIYNRALTENEIKQLYNLGEAKFSSTPKGITAGLVGHWTMDGKDINWATGKVNDVSGNANHGNISNMSTTTSPVMGKIGQALSFDGVDDTVTTPTINFSGSEFTFSFWLKTNATVDHVFLSWRHTRYCALLSGGNTGKLSCTVDGTAVNGASTDFAINNNQWQHIVFVVNGNNQAIYLNGLKHGTASATLDTTNDTVVIGRRNFGGFGRAEMDDVRIYNRVLSESEVKQLYLMGR